MPRSGPHWRLPHAETHTRSGATQRPTPLHAHPVSGQLPHDPPMPSGPHSRLVQLRVPASVGAAMQMPAEALHASPAPHEPQEAPHPSGPHSRPSQFDMHPVGHMHPLNAVPSALQVRVAWTPPVHPHASVVPGEHTRHDAHME